VFVNLTDRMRKSSRSNVKEADIDKYTD